jgi:hypothetical protein
LIYDWAYATPFHDTEQRVASLLASSTSTDESQVLRRSAVRAMLKSRVRVIAELKRRILGLRACHAAGASTP